MPNIAALLAPMVLLMPLHVAEDVARPKSAEQSVSFAATPQKAPSQPVYLWLTADGVIGTPVQYQVRIKQQVIIRVSPRRPVVRENLNSEMTQRRRPQRLIERKMGKCVKMKGIAGVQSTRDNRLMLYMRDKRMIAANLEKACSARDFYSGFYVEPSKDGNLCINRDKLQSRTGTKCELSRLRQMVPEQT